MKALALIRQGLAGLAEAGSRVGITDFLTRLAEAQALDGKIDDALITIEEALQANPEELVFRPNALTCRGELRLKLGQTELAETDFREAIALAQKMQAKAWELRATISLARLLAIARPSRRSAHDARRTSTTGSPRASTPPTSKTPRPCSTSWTPYEPEARRSAPTWHKL